MVDAGCCCPDVPARRSIAGVHRSATHDRCGSRPLHTFRRTGIAHVLFGRFEDDVLDDDELDTMILMPAIVIGCGLCLTALFLLGYDNLA